MAINMTRILHNLTLGLILLIAFAGVTSVLPSSANAQSTGNCWVNNTVVDLAIGSCSMNDVSQACRGGGACDTRDKTLLSALGGMCNGPASVTCSADMQEQATAANSLMQSSQNAAQPQIGVCAGTIFTRSLNDNGNCMVASFFVTAGSAIVSVLTTIPWAADRILKFVIDNTVLTSGFTSLYTTFSSSVGFAWTFIRDLMNIAIIGVFVFIAISIILGLQTFGQKKLIANVLIIAVLINFSYLLTTIVINFSNALSTNIYSQLILKQTGSVGIGSKFLVDLKVNTINDYSNTTTAFTNTYNNGGGLGPLLMHIFVSGLFAVMAGLALLFAAFLLIARFIMLIFLLITSSAAFAAYMSPATKSWWSTWWSQLFKNAFLAPIMLVFLSIALNLSTGISQSMDKIAPGGKFGNITTGAIQEPQIALLVNYFLILGILMAGIIIAKSLSTQAAISVTGSSVLVPGGLAAALGGFGGNFLAYRRLKSLEGRKNAVQQDYKMDPAEKQRRLMELGRGIEKYKGLSKKDLNVMNTGVSKSAAKSLFGLSGLAAGQSKIPSYGKYVEDRGKKLGHAAGHTETTKDNKVAAEHKAVGAEREKAADLAKEKKEHEQQIQVASAQKDAAHEQKKAAEQQIKTLREEHSRLGADSAALKSAASAEGNPGAAARDRIAKNAARAQEIMQQSEAAQKALATFEKHIERVSGPLAASQKRVSEISGQQAALQHTIDTKLAEVKKGFDDYSTYLGKSLPSSLNSDIAKEAKTYLRKHHQEENLKKALAAAGGGGDGHGDTKGKDGGDDHH